MLNDGDQLTDEDEPLEGSTGVSDSDFPNPAAEVVELEETLAQLEKAKGKAQS
jgi:hypothetical protein